MTDVIHHQTPDELNYWVGRSPAVLGNDIGGLKTPDQVSYFVCENLTDDGVQFEQPPFQAGRVDGVLRVLPTTEGNDLFGRVSAAFSRKNFAHQMVDANNDAVVALWTLDEDTVALFVGESNGSLVQDMWYDSCRFAGIPPFEDGAVVDSSRFDIASAAVPAALSATVQSLRPTVRPKVGM